MSVFTVGHSNRSFHNYADYALSGEFRDGLDEVLQRGRDGHLTVMCAEAVWRRCHRRIVADYLIARDHPVFHIMSEGRSEPATLTPGAVIQDDHRITYPPPHEGAKRPAT